MTRVILCNRCGHKFNTLRVIQTSSRHDIQFIHAETESFIPLTPPPTITIYKYHNVANVHQASHLLFASLHHKKTTSIFCVPTHSCCLRLPPLNTSGSHSSNYLRPNSIVKQGTLKYHFDELF